MKIVLDIANASVLKKPTENHIILYDGEKWYVTTKKALFKEYEDKVDAKLAEFEETKAELEQEVKDFKQKVAQDLLTMSEIVEGVITK